MCEVLVLLAAICGTERFLQPGDTVVLVGDDLIERAQITSYLEAGLRSRFPGCDVRVRNLGWSGDTTDGQSRAYFDSPAKGTERLRDQVAELEPTVLLVGFGMADSLSDRTSEVFIQQLTERLEEWSTTIREVVFLSPIAHESLPAPLPNPEPHNKVLVQYRNALQQLAHERQSKLLDTFSSSQELMTRLRPDQSLTTNGIHLTEQGNWWLGLELQEALRLDRGNIELALSGMGGTVHAKGATIEVDGSTDSSITFRVTPEELPACLPPDRLHPSAEHPLRSNVVVRVSGLDDGTYSLTLDGEEVKQENAAAWKEGVVLRETPFHEQSEKLRQLIQRKNQLYFDSYRPQNITYLLGFRQHEQGQNASELKDLLTIVEQLDSEITELTKPVEITCQLKALSN